MSESHRARLEAQGTALLALDNPEDMKEQLFRSACAMFEAGAAYAQLAMEFEDMKRRAEKLEEHCIELAESEQRLKTALGEARDLLRERDGHTLRLQERLRRMEERLETDK